MNVDTPRPEGFQRVVRLGHRQAPVVLIDRERFRFDAVWSAVGHPETEAA